jgi:hypothetical protein
LRNDFLIGVPIAPNDREKIEFHFRNDLPVRFNFQMFTSCINAFRLVYTVDLRILPGRFPHNFSLFGGILAGNAEAQARSTAVALELSVKACTRSIST